MLGRAASTARRRWPFLLIGALTLSSVLFAGLWLGAATAGSSQVSASFSGVKMNKFDAVDGGGDVCATTSGWSDVPGASQTFKLGGTVSRPVLVDVSLQAYANSTAWGGAVRLMIDGFQQGVGTLRLWGDQGPYLPESPASYTFLTPTLTPGNHTAKIQFEDVIENGLCLHHWTLAILHI
jgi:hypothetical protein